MRIDFVLLHQAAYGGWEVPLGPTNQHILFLVTKGAVIYEIEGKTLQIGQGEGLFMPKGTLRTSTAIPGDPHVMYAAYFSDVPWEELAPFLNEPYKWFRPHSYDYLKQRFSMLHECWVGKMQGYDLITRGILMEMMGIVQRDLFAGSRPSSRRSLVLQMQEYIIRHYCEQLQISDLANYVDRSPTYVSTVFKQVTNRSPITYMHEVRIAAARDLLMTTNMTIGEIAETLGYCDQTYFNHMYKKIVGHPPSYTLKLQN
ncbi:AraC family transcriptional regulator [Paenibacillus nasutitermitis]|uniref:AraC family transcriptional regulator n=1 Tax=Paenibacillus nasutitermitis TaxID=1652958 RepID=A0A916YJC2_9BACL|nr:AraC family transcriptional regulator [Paenibacillus nasutitermitis]GGD47055.1 AraC family transcriptional regulator [Paenibacillus nasutitermitis]